MERAIVAFGEEMGVDVEVHDGYTEGQGVSRLAALVHRTDRGVIATGINDHNAVQVAKREATKAGKRVLILTACGAGTAHAVAARCVRLDTVADVV